MTQTTIATDPSIDELARKWTQAKDLATLLEPTTTYFPSLYPPPFATAAEVEELRRLADAYDQAQEARGDKRRAHRGSPEWWTVRQPPPPTLSADIVQEGATWTARLRQHPPEGGDGTLVWEQSGLRSQHAAEVAMEAANRRLTQQPRVRGRAWTDAYQLGDEVLYRTTYRAPAQPGRVHALIPARADLRTTAPDLWRSICVDQGQSPDVPPWQIAPQAAMARLVVLLTPVEHRSGRVTPARVRVVARASALEMVR